jgi:hypothetical protein
VCGDPVGEAVARDVEDTEGGESSEGAREGRGSGIARALEISDGDNIGGGEAEVGE